MGFVVDKDFDVVHYLVDEYLQAPRMASANTKAARAERDAEYRGARKALATALGAVLTAERIKMYPLITTGYDLLMEWHVQAELSWYLGEVPTPDRETRAKHIADAEAKLHKLAEGDETFQKMYAIIRRDKIEKGEVSFGFATQEDIDYWEKARQKSIEQAERFAVLAKSKKEN